MISIYFGLALILFLTNCASLDHNHKKTNITETNIFGNDATTLSDQNYFTKVVLEYNINKTILAKYGRVNSSTIDPQNPSKVYENPIDVLSLWLPEETNISDQPVYKKVCQFKIPKNLTDLNSGFQYKYYLFSNKSNAAMQAFGITDIESEKDIQYLVIDYIQFKDLECNVLPEIRYAVGLRSELKIKRINDSLSFDIGLGKLADLAAQVQLGQAEVNFSLKTIGLTGTKSRLNIPQGVSFNVSTYRDFQNAIEFLKTDLDSIHDKNVSPEIIPITDDYRPNIYNSIITLTEELERIGSLKHRIELNDSLDLNIKNQILNTLDIHASTMQKQNKSLVLADSSLRSISRLEKLISDINTPTKLEALDKLSNPSQTDYNYDSLLVEFQTYAISAEVENIKENYPAISDIDTAVLTNLIEIYILSDGITFDGFYNHFIPELNNLNISTNELLEINNELGTSNSPNDQLLENIITSLKNKRGLPSQD